MKVFILSGFLMLSGVCYSQVDSLINLTFYGLDPIHGTRFDIVAKLKRDNRFVETTSSMMDTNFFETKYLFWGTTNYSGIVQQQTDSTKIQFGSIGIIDTEEGIKRYSYLSFEYFYNSNDSAELAYKNIIQKLDQLAIDKTQGLLETFDFKANKTTLDFKLDKLKFRVEVQKRVFFQPKYSLLITFYKKWKK